MHNPRRKVTLVALMERHGKLSAGIGKKTSRIEIPPGHPFSCVRCIYTSHSEAANENFSSIQIGEDQELTIWGAVTYIIHQAR
jgi:hypothetical protein